jgi:hypothetical protein
LKPRGDRCIAWDVSPRYGENNKKKSRGAAADICGEVRGSDQVQRHVSGAAINGRNQDHCPWHLSLHLIAEPDTCR